MFDGIRQYYQELIPALSAEEWEELEKRLIIEEYPKGSMVCREGENCKGVYYIHKGLARLYYTVEGREICTGFAKEGEYLSEYDSFLTQTPASQSMDVLEDTVAINLPYEKMQELYRNYPIYNQAGRKIAEGLFILISRYNTRLLTLIPEDRYQYIVDNQYHLIQRVPQYMLASFIGISPEHLSRIRKKMAR